MQDIKLPKPEIIHGYEKIDDFTKRNVIRAWRGSNLATSIFYLYLFNKYKTKCVIYSNISKSIFVIGIELFINHKLEQSKKTQYESYLENVSNQLKNCIKRNTTSFVIPLVLCFSDNSGHANLLIYRKNDNTIEHFEPHGKYGPNYEDTVYIEKELNRFIDILNKKLKEDKIDIVKFKTSNDVCPVIYGFQTIEEIYGNKKETIEGGGYCAAWSMFFAELCLKNPNISSNELLILIFNKLNDMSLTDRGKYLRKLIRGYVDVIYDKICKYYKFLTSKNTESMIISPMIDNKIVKNFKLFIDIEMILMNNESMTKSQYLEILQTSLNDTSISKTDKKIISNKINMLKKIDGILNPSLSNYEIPHESQYSIEYSLSKRCPKGRIRDKKTHKCIKKNIQPKPEPNNESPHSIEHPLSKRCPKGRTRDKKTHKCVKKH